MKRNAVKYTESYHYRCLEELDQVRMSGSVSPLVLAYCGVEDCSPGQSFGPYIRQNYVIHVVTKGKGIYCVNDNRYEVAKNQMFQICPGEETFYQADPEDPWTYMWIGFSGYKSGKLVEKIGFSKEKHVLDLNSTEGISNAIGRILDSRELSVSDVIKRSSTFLETLSLMLENTDSSIYIPLDSRLQARYVYAAADIIAASYDKKIRISVIAAQVGVNRSYLTSLFKKELVMSPQEYLINYRLERACEILKGTEDSIGSIAAAVGYSDALAFSKAFKQKYDMTPTEYSRVNPVIKPNEQPGIL